MSEGHSLNNLEQLVNRICEATHQDQVSLDSILDVLGRRSFGSLLLLAGLITLLPVIGDIPGVPTIIGLFVFLTGGQVLVGREHVWFPRWLLDRSVSRDKISKAVEWLRPPARFVDRFLRPRLALFTSQTALYIIAGLCIIIAAAMPVMEVVPFSANLADVALTAFGLSLITQDGILALIAFVFTAGMTGLVVYNLL